MKRLMTILGVLVSHFIYALPSPYNELREVLPFDPQGWYYNSPQIETIFRERKIQTVIEVGSWLGKSTLHIASLLPADGKLYAVDHWLGSAEHQPGKFAWYRALPYLYEQFLSNVIHAGLTDKIIPIRMESLQAAKTLNVFPDLIYLDAAHDTESVYADIKAWYPFVKGHGVLCGDDWQWESVSNAVKRFAAENNLSIKASGYLWRLVEQF